MGLSLFKSCGTRYTPAAPAPNPRPDRWSLLDRWDYRHGYVLRVHYLDATNFEGVKVLVYRGAFLNRRSRLLDPHFTPDADSPVARFRPDDDGIAMAKALAKSLAGKG
jgi:hypothetical protein